MLSEPQTLPPRKKPHLDTMEGFPAAEIGEPNGGPCGLTIAVGQGSILMLIYRESLRHGVIVIVTYCYRYYRYMIKITTIIIDIVIIIKYHYFTHPVYWV